MDNFDLRKYLSEGKLFEGDKNLTPDPYTGQIEMFDIPEQFDMNGPQKDAYRVWEKAIKEKYGRKTKLVPTDLEGGKGYTLNDKGTLDFIPFNLSFGYTSIRKFITINKEGKVELPISFYLDSPKSKPDWMNYSNSYSRRPLNMNDLPEILAGLGEI